MLGGVALDLEIAISVPLIECLVDNVRYFRSDTLPPPQGEELRPLYRPQKTRGDARAELPSVGPSCGETRPRPASRQASEAAAMVAKIGPAKTMTSCQISNLRTSDARISPKAIFCG